MQISGNFRWPNYPRPPSHTIPGLLEEREGERETHTHTQRVRERQGETERERESDREGQRDRKRKKRSEFGEREIDRKSEIKKY